VGIDMNDALSDEALQRVLEQLAWHFTPDEATRRALMERTISLWQMIQTCPLMTLCF
jgi:hypothetical protein